MSGARRLVKSTPTSNPFFAACCSALSSQVSRLVIVDDADRLHPGVDDDGSHELETALSHGI